LVSTAFYLGKEKLRHSLGRPSRSDFVQLEFVKETFLMTMNKGVSVRINRINLNREKSEK
jgi:hypothetical protein